MTLNAVGPALFEPPDPKNVNLYESNGFFRIMKLKVPKLEWLLRRDMLRICDLSHMVFSLSTTLLLKTSTVLEHRFFNRTCRFTYSTVALTRVVVGLRSQQQVPNRFNRLKFNHITDQQITQITDVFRHLMGVHFSQSQSFSSLPFNKERSKKNSTRTMSSNPLPLNTFLHQTIQQPVSVFDNDDGTMEKQLLEEALMYEKRPKKKARLINAIEQCNKATGYQMSTISGISMPQQKEAAWEIQNSEIEENTPMIASQEMPNGQGQTLKEVLKNNDTSASSETEKIAVKNRNHLYSTKKKNAKESNVHMDFIELNHQSNTDLKIKRVLRNSEGTLGRKIITNKKIAQSGRNKELNELLEQNSKCNSIHRNTSEYEFKNDKSVTTTSVETSNSDKHNIVDKHVFLANHERDYPVVSSLFPNDFNLESIDPKAVVTSLKERQLNDTEKEVIDAIVVLPNYPKKQWKEISEKDSINPISELKLQALEMQQTEIDPVTNERIKDLSTYYFGIERQKRKEEMLHSSITLNELIESGRGSIENINNLIKAKSLQGRLDEGLSIYDDSITLGYQPNSETFLSLMQGAAERKDAEAARMIYLKMRSRLITPTNRVYCALIHAHVRSDDLTSGFTLLRKMENEGFKPDVVIYTTLINGLVESGNHKLAWNIFYDMRSWKLIEPDEVLFTVMIKSCAMTDEAEKAINIYDDMRVSGKRPTDVTYSELIHACCRQQYFFDKVFDFFNQMKAEDMPITPDIYEYLLIACSNKGNLNKAKDIIAEMGDHGIRLNMKCCLALIKTLAEIIRGHKRSEIKRDATLAQTWSVLHYLHNSSEIITTDLLNAVMSVYINSGLWNYSIDMLTQYAQFKCDPNVETYHQLLEMFYFELTDPGRFFGLWNFINEETSIKPTSTMYNLAVNAAIMSGSANQTLNVLQNMYTMKIFPSRQLAARLSRVGRHIPQLTELMMSFIKLERQLQTNKTIIENTSIEANLQEHELNQYAKGRTTKSLSPEDEVRKEYFEKREKEMEGKHRIPRGLHRQLKKEGGEYYSKIRDGHTPNLIKPGAGISA